MWCSKKIILKQLRVEGSSIYHEDENEACYSEQSHKQGVFYSQKCSIQQEKPNGDAEYG